MRTTYIIGSRSTSFLMLALIGATIFCSAKCQEGASKIRINQLGYYTEGPKAAVITAPVESDDFFVLEASTKDTVFRGKLGEETASHNSSMVTRYAEFTSLQKTGTYVIA